MHFYNKKKDLLILGESPTQVLHGTTLSAEKNYSIGFTEQYKKFCLSLHYNRVNSDDVEMMMFIMMLKFINSKEKIPKLMQLHYA